MQKNILKATLVVSFALIAGMNVYNAQQSDVMSDLALALSLIHISQMDFKHIKFHFTSEF